MAIADDLNADIKPAMDKVSAFERELHLDAESFEEYVNEELSLENALYNLAELQFASLDHVGATALLEEVGRLNRSMVEIATRELERERDDEIDPAHRESLERWRDLAHGMIYVVEGQQALWDAHFNLIQLQNVDEVHDSYQRAFDAFRQILELELPQTDIAGVRCDQCRYMDNIVTGLNDLNLANYGNAIFTFDTAAANMHALLRSLPEPAEGDGEDEKVSGVEEIRRLVGNDMVTTDSYLRMARFFLAINTSDFAQGVVHGDQMVASTKLSLEAAELMGLHERVLDLRRSELEVQTGWLCWASAELAADRHRWDESREQIGLAREHWYAAATVGARSQFPAVQSIRSQLGTFNILLTSATERVEREERLAEQIEELRATVRRINGPPAVYVKAEGGKVMQDNSGDRIEVGGINVDGHNAAINIKGTQDVTSKVEANKTTTTTESPTSAAELSKLVAELGELRRAIEAGAEEPAEREAVAALQAAEDAARKDDQPAVRSNLAKAGRWALDTASTLGLKVAEAAIRKGLGI